MRVDRVYGEEIGQSVEEKARRTIAEELAKAGWEEAELSQRRKGDARKVRIARRLRCETTVSNVTFCLRTSGNRE